MNREEFEELWKQFEDSTITIRMSFVLMSEIIRRSYPEGSLPRVRKNITYMAERGLISSRGELNWQRIRAHVAGLGKDLDGGRYV